MAATAPIPVALPPPSSGGGGGSRRRGRSAGSRGPPMPPRNPTEDFAGFLRHFLTDSDENPRIRANINMREFAEDAQRPVTDQIVTQLAVVAGDLVHLDLGECHRITDASLVALGSHCPRIKFLNLQGCFEITITGIRHITASCGRLEELLLADCDNIDDACLTIIAAQTPHLRKLDVSNCRKISDKGVRDLCVSLKELRDVRLRGLPKVTAIGVQALTSTQKKLNMLDIGGCERINERKLKLRDSIARPEDHRAKRDAERLAALEAEERDQRARLWGTCMIQAALRGMRARRRVRLIRLEHQVRVSVPLIQSVVRMFLAKLRVGQIRAVRDRRRAAIVIQTCFRCWRVWKPHHEFLERRAMFRHNRTKVVHVQKFWRGIKGRQRATARRNELAAIRLQAAKTRAQREMAAVVIQRQWHACVSRHNFKLLLVQVAEMKAEAQLRNEIIVRVQRRHRGIMARKRFKIMVEEHKYQVMRWYSARSIQAGIRGMLARARVRRMRWELEMKRRQAAAIELQRAWRGNRGRYLAKVARALEEWRKIEHQQAAEIQKIVRGKLARERVKRLLLSLQEERLRQRSAMAIQRVFRGHKGREHFEVEWNLREMADRARPLIQRLEELAQEHADTDTGVQHALQRFRELKQDTDDLEEEYRVARNTSGKWTDSRRINNTEQRFMTKFLVVRLKELLEERAIMLEKLSAEVRDKRHHIKMLEKHMRFTKRELVPLTTGLVDKTRVERTKRLRNTVRTRKAAATAIQKIARGVRARAAIWNEYRLFWVEAEDDVTCDRYYYNTESGESSWTVPFECQLFPETLTRMEDQPSSDPYADEDSDDGY